MEHLRQVLQEVFQRWACCHGRRQRHGAVTPGASAVGQDVGGTVMCKTLPRVGLG